MIPSEHEVKAESARIAKQIVEVALNKKDVEALVAGALMGSYYRGMTDTLRAQAMADVAGRFDQPVSGEMLRKWGAMLGVPPLPDEDEKKYRTRVAQAARKMGTEAPNERA